MAGRKADAATPEALCRAIREGQAGPLFLVAGDRVLAEPAALRIAEELARRSGCEVEVHRRPGTLSPLLADLRTCSLFSSAKVSVAIESAVLADTAAAAQLIDEALEVLPLPAGAASELSSRETRAASRLLQVLRLFQIDPDAGRCEEVVAALPGSALAGGRVGGRRKRRTKSQVVEARERLAELLEAARVAGLRGWADTELGELAAIAEGGLPEGHALVLAESAVARQHPLVTTLTALGRCAVVGRVEAARGGGWRGHEALAAELERETGVGMSGDAVQELARRTIQRLRTRGGSAGEVDGDSTTRFAAEYRKLAGLVAGDSIEKALVEEVVEDRGEEDSWKILDAIGAGEEREALRRLSRLLAAAEDVVAARLAFYSLMASFARQLVAVVGLLDLLEVPRRKLSYAAFKSELAPRLQADLADGSPSPVGGLHPFRLYRAYSVARRASAERIIELPARILETEMQLKGESGQPDAALSLLLCDLASVTRAES